MTLVDVLALVANTGLYLASFRVLTPKGVPTRSLVPGSIVGAVVWTLLQYFGVLVVHHFDSFPERLPARQRSVGLDGE